MAIFLGNIKGLDVSGSQFTYMVFDIGTGSAPVLYHSASNIHSTSEIATDINKIGRIIVDNANYTQQINKLSFETIGSGSNIQVTNTGANAWTFNGSMAISGVHQLTTYNLGFTTGTGSNLAIEAATASDLTVTNLTLNNGDGSGTWNSEGIKLGNSKIKNDHIEAVYYNATSDKNLKKDFVALPSVLKMIQDTPVYSFNYKGTNLPSIGIMAQDVEQYSFDKFKLVDSSSDGVLSIHESKLVYILWKGIQEQQQQIEELRAEIAKLQGGK